MKAYFNIYIVPILVLVAALLSMQWPGSIHLPMLILLLGGFAIGYLNPTKGWLSAICTIIILFLIVQLFGHNIGVFPNTKLHFVLYLAAVPLLSAGLIGSYIKKIF
jgi:hypothetical protein